jgi:hypothetical protein
MKGNIVGSEVSLTGDTLFGYLQVQQQPFVEIAHRFWHVPSGGVSEQKEDPVKESYHKARIEL